MEVQSQSLVFPLPREPGPRTILRNSPSFSSFRKGRGTAVAVSIFLSYGAVPSP